MEQVPNLRPGLPVAITSLDKDGGTFLTRVVEANGNQITVVANAQLKMGGLLTVETDHDWIMTEVSQCEADGDGYRAGLNAMESVSKLDLRRIRDALYETQPEPASSFAAA